MLIRLLHIFLGKGIECYYCRSSKGKSDEECDSKHHGFTVSCQMENPNDDYYGDACAIGHTGNLFTLSKCTKSKNTFSTNC